MWPFNYFNKSKEIDWGDKYLPAVIFDAKPITEETAKLPEFVQPTQEEKIPDSPATTNSEVPMGILVDYANWTDTTISSLKESRTILAARITKDQEELRQIDKVIEGMGLMKDTIISEEPSFQTPPPPAKPTKPRKPNPVGQLAPEQSS